MIELNHSRRYVNENVHRVRKVFRWAASEQLIPVSVPEALATVEGLRKGHTKAPCRRRSRGRAVRSARRLLLP
jgi:hypothetical protein